MRLTQRIQIVPTERLRTRDRDDVEAVISDEVVIVRRCRAPNQESEQAGDEATPAARGRRNTTTARTASIPGVVVPVELNVVDGVGAGGEALRYGDAELFADRSDRAGRDLAVSWDGRAEIAGGLVPDAVPGAFAQELTPVSSEVTLELATIQAAARSIVIGST